MCLPLPLPYDKRHPRRCSWFQEYGRCKFTSFCKFKHENEQNQDEIVNGIKSNESKLIDIEQKLGDIKKEETKTLKRL